MANRKVLINRHTTGSTAPTASEMYLGEIAVAHETGKETLWTKNNAGDMVPFISCAQTISMIESKIQSSDTDVMVKAGEQHLEVSAGTGDEANKFTLNTVDVQSEAEFEAYSARTTGALSALTQAFEQLLDVTVTGISGDTIIVATPVGNDSGANKYNLTHRTGEETSGFKKLTTDAYGHVTASTDVTTEDIQALGFKTSAQTGEDLETLSASVVSNENKITALSAGTIQLSADTKAADAAVFSSATTYANDAIAAAIEALDSETAVTAGKYLTGIAIADGKISGITEEDLPTLSVVSAGTGNVVSQITVNGHEITYQTASVATSEGIAELSASVITNKDNIEALSAGTIQLSGDTDAAIEALSANTMAADAEVFASAKTYTDEKIAALDSSTATTDNKHYLTSVTITDGMITAMGEEAVPELASAVTGTGNVVTDIAVNDHTITFTKGLTVAADSDLKALSAAVETNEDNIEALSAGTINDINVLSGAVKANETNINTVSGDVIELSAATVAIETGLDNLSAVTLTGVSLNNTPLTVTDHVATVPVADDKDDIANATASGTVADAKAVKDYVNEVLTTGVNYKGATSGEPAGTPKTGDLYIADSAFTVDGKNVEVGDFIIYNGTGWDVIEKNLDGAITGNLTADTVTLGNGAHTAKSLANGSDGQVLTMVSGEPAWADDPELSSATTGTGNVVTSILVNDHEITYVKDFTAASNADLEIVSGIVDTFSAATVAEFNSAFTAINTLSADAHNSMIARDDAVFSSAVTYVDEQIDEVYASAVSYADSAITYAIEGLDSVGSASTTGHYLTSVTITDGKISAVGEVAVPAAVAITATTATPVDTASAVLTGVTADGTDNHNLTFGMSNKVFSAETANSALTAVDLTGNITTGQVTGLQELIEETKSDSATTAESAVTSNSALTSESALTSVSATVAADAVHASAATKVDEKLILSDDTNDIEYDGSEEQTITFGTACTSTDVTNERSMTMDTNGVVDVNVIDCGEY